MDSLHEKKAVMYKKKTKKKNPLKSHTVSKLLNFTATILLQKFRENNFFTKEIYSELV